MNKEGGQEGRNIQLSGVGKNVISPVNVGLGRTGVKMEMGCQGRDLFFLLTGGEAHVGAVAVWNSGRSDVSATVTELPGHKEGPLAGACAEIVGRTTGRTVAGVVGIHQDEATPEEIEAIVANAKQAARLAAEEFLQRNGPSNEE